MTAAYNHGAVLVCHKMMPADMPAACRFTIQSLLHVLSGCTCSTCTHAVAANRLSRVLMCSDASVQMDIAAADGMDMSKAACAFGPINPSDWNNQGLQVDDP